MRSNAAINKVFSGDEIEIVESVRWPITESSRFVSVLLHEPTGQRIAWIHGPVTCFAGESVPRISIRECFGAGACEKCVYECCIGKLTGDASVTHAGFEMRYMGTGRLRSIGFTDVPLCGVCYNDGLREVRRKLDSICERISQQRERFCAQFENR